MSTAVALQLQCSRSAAGLQTLCSGFAGELRGLAKTGDFVCAGGLFVGLKGIFTKRTHLS
jgi:hypothetical protein